MATPTFDEAAVFNEARLIAEPEARRRYLEQVCGSDRALLARLEALLRVYDQEHTFLETPAAGVQDLRGAEIGEGPGSIIGPYKLLEKIGEGGFGVVYLAEQQQPIRRTVAIKILKPGMDTHQVVARFEAERQALALMDHPNIARVFDGGATASGRPFFVMELVKGVPITDYCDAHLLTPRERLELFATVCRAVQHAHQKGVIHRDLKPTNVLIADYDGKPVPKLIDFGIAKAVGQRLTEQTFVTGIGNIIGTLDYMSPEQAEFNAVDIDTRADIYSLGVLLYELLTGTTPLTHERLNQAALTEALRLIREEEPPRPSSRLGDTSVALAAISAQRKLEPARLTREVRGDLDWIVMKALDKDRNRRYATPGNFAEDVERYLNNDAILARPPSAIYRLRKFAHRRRGLVATVAAVMAALLVGIVIATWQAVVASRAESKARASAAESNAVLDFLENYILAAARPEGKDGGLGRDVSLKQALEAALPRVDASFAQQPLVEARLRMTLGTSFRYLGDADVAARQFERARKTYDELLGPESAEALTSMDGLASAYADLDREPEALALRKKTLEIRRRVLGSDHVDTLGSMRNLANSYAAARRRQEALDLDQETFDRMRATLGPDDPRTLGSMNSLALSHSALKQYQAALTIQQEALRRYQVALPANHPDVLVLMSNLGKTYSDLERFEEARDLEEKLVELENTKFGPDHQYTLHTQYALAQTYFSLNRFGDALRLHQAALDGRLAKYGDDHYDTLLSEWGTALTLTKLNRGAEAIPIIDRCLAHVPGKEHRADFVLVADLRLRYFAKTKNAEECHKTAEMWEKIGSTDAGSYYNAACIRSVTAAVILETDKSPAGKKKADEEADRAMRWLEQAIAAGFKDMKTLKGDSDLDPLRKRADFMNLLAKMEAKKG